MLRHHTGMDLGPLTTYHITSPKTSAWQTLVHGYIGNVWMKILICFFYSIKCFTFFYGTWCFIPDICCIIYECLWLKLRTPFNHYVRIVFRFLGLLFSVHHFFLTIRLDKLVCSWTSKLLITLFEHWFGLLSVT